MLCFRFWKEVRRLLAAGPRQAVAGCSLVGPHNVKQDTGSTRVNWESVLLTHHRGSELSSPTARSCAEPSSPPAAADSQHMCKVINSYYLTAETKWTGTELENVRAKKQRSSSREGHGTALPAHSALGSEYTHDHVEENNPLLPSQQCCYWSLHKEHLYSAEMESHCATYRLCLQKCNTLTQQNGGSSIGQRGTGRLSDETKVTDTAKGCWGCL